MAAGDGSPKPPAWRAGLETLPSARPVRLARDVMDGYSRAGGSLLAAGLAYQALFALVPGVLLILGIAGVVLGDGSLHDAFVRNVAAVIPPLHDMLAPTLDDLASRAGGTTLVGAIGLAWGASRFYDSFESALNRVFGGVTRRSFITRTALGFLSVALLGMAFGLVTTLAGVRAFLDAATAQGGRPLVGAAGIAVDLAGPVVTIASVAMVYRMVPHRRPAWRAIAVPAVVVAVSLVVVARLFVFLAPRLIGAAAVLGTLATVFAALAWLGLSFQAVLLGAAWIDHADREAAEDALTAS